MHRLAHELAAQQGMTPPIHPPWPEAQQVPDPDGPPAEGPRHHPPMTIGAFHAAARRLAPHHDRQHLAESGDDRAAAQGPGLDRLEGGEHPLRGNPTGDVVDGPDTDAPLRGLEYEHGRPGHSAMLPAVVEVPGSHDLACGIAQKLEWQIEFPLVLGGLFGAIDGQRRHPGSGLDEPVVNVAVGDQLPPAERSPMAAIEEKDEKLISDHVVQPPRGALGVHDGEIGGDLPQLRAAWTSWRRPGHAGLQNGLLISRHRAAVGTTVHELSQPLGIETDDEVLAVRDGRHAGSASECPPLP